MEIIAFTSSFISGKASVHIATFPPKIIFEAIDLFPLSSASEAVTRDEKSVEEELSDSTNDVLNDIDFSELEDLVLELDVDLFSGKTFKQYVKDVIDGKESFDISTFFQMMKLMIAKNIKTILSPLLIVLCIALLCVLFSNMQSGKMGEHLEIVYLICFSVVVIIVSVIISKLVLNSKNGIMKMQKNMNAIFPILLLLMSNMGGAISAKAYTPLVSVLSNIISNIFVYFLLPLFSLSLVLSIISHISPNTKLNKLNGFIKSLFKWVIGSVCAVFMGYLAIKGFTAGASDGISIKATKYAIKNYVPILGGYISEGFELVKAGSLIVKNAIGFVGSLSFCSSVSRISFCSSSSGESFLVKNGVDKDTLAILFTRFLSAKTCGISFPFSSISGTIPRSS